MTINTAQGAYSTIPGGKYAKASNYGQQAYASGWFSKDGDACKRRSNNGSSALLVKYKTVFN